MRLNEIKPEFVTSAPDVLEEGKLYISLPFRLAMHKCCCGCGREVTNRISRTGWEFTFDGENVSLWPSIGPSTLACKSHYVVRRGKLKWFPPMTDAQIERARLRDARLRAGLPDPEPELKPTPSVAEQEPPLAKRQGLFARIAGWILGRE